MKSIKLAACYVKFVRIDLAYEYYSTMYPIDRS